MRRRWTSEETIRLKQLVRSGKYSYPEISERLGRDREGCTQKAQSLGLRNPVYHDRIKKHVHLREPVMRYFLTHSREEVQQRFALTYSEVKSLFTSAYRDPKLAHLRKDSRRKDSWNIDEMLFLIRHAGLQPRSWIAKKLKRGTMQSEKEVLSRLSSNSKYLNGIPHAWALDLFGASAVGRGIKTKAGPTGSGPNGFQYRLVPWVDCERMMRGRRLSPEIRASVRAMAKFQRWIHGVNTDWYLQNKLKQTCNRR